MSSLLHAIDRCLYVDEIGIEFARLSGIIFKTGMKPLYRIADGKLFAAGVSAATVAFERGRRLEAARTDVLRAAGDTGLFDAICRELHFRNLRGPNGDRQLALIGMGACGAHDSDRTLMQLGRFSAALRDRSLDPGMLVWELSLHGNDATACLRQVEALREAGMKLALGDFGADAAALDMFDALEPDLVRIDGAWFGRVAEFESAVRLLVQLIEMLRARGASVLITGISNARELEAAIASGADLLQGEHLARSLLFGALAGEGTRSSRESLADRLDRIVPLFSVGVFHHGM